MDADALNVCTPLRASPVRFDLVCTAHKDPWAEKRLSASFWSDAGITCALPGGAAVTIGLGSPQAQSAVMPCTGGGQDEEEPGKKV